MADRYDSYENGNGIENEFSEANATQPKAAQTNVGGNTLDSAFKVSPELKGASEYDYNGFMAIGGDMANTVQNHIAAMKKLVDGKYDITPISDGWKYPIITYSKKVDNVVFYYPTIITDDDKRAMPLSSFVQGLSQKEADVYTLDVMYEDNEDQEIRAKLKALYPTISEFKHIATSVVKYSEETYQDIFILVSRLIDVAPIVSSGKDLTLVNIPKNFKISYQDIPNGTKMTRTGMSVRADFKLTLSSNNNTAKVSNNSTNKEVAWAYGYIDLIPEEEVIQQSYAQPIINKKLRPVVILTDVFGLAASSSYALLGIITGANMLSRDMYMGYILKHANRFSDLIGVVLQENVDMAKLTPGEKADILENLIISPIMAIDVPNNGYLEEIGYMLQNTGNAAIKNVATRLLGKNYGSDLIDFCLPLPYVEYFDRTAKDVRDIDTAKVAAITKDISMVLGFAKITNDISQDLGATVSNLAALLNEIGIDGEIIGTYGRLFLTEKGIAELIASSGMKINYSALYEAPKSASTFLRRQGYSTQSNYYTPSTGAGNGPRGYRPF